jgi:hypothetical protein
MVLLLVIYNFSPLQSRRVGCFSFCLQQAERGFEYYTQARRKKKREGGEKEKKRRGPRPSGDAVQ